MPETFTYSFGFTNTQAATPLEIEIPKVDYASDYARHSATDGEAIVDNTTTPIDQPYQAVFSRRSIKNIYDGIKTIDPTLWAANKRGAEIRSAVRLTFRQTRVSDGTYIDYPVTGNLALTVPLSAGFTSEHLGTVISELIGHLAAGQTGLTDLSDSTRLNELIRGSLLPPDVS